MKIAIAQILSLTGDISGNLHKHHQICLLAASLGANVLVFPELSLTAYEPELAEHLAIQIDDDRLEVLQELSDRTGLTIGAGAPVKTSKGIVIGMLIFQSHQARQCYAKQFLHADEEPFFVRGDHQSALLGSHPEIAPAICYEISVAEHAARAAQSGAQFYLASVAKFVSGIDRAYQSLSDIARRHRMTVLMCNGIGRADGAECAGKSAVWDAAGVLMEHLDETGEGLLVLDTDTRELTVKRISDPENTKP